MIFDLAKCLKYALFYYCHENKLSFDESPCCKEWKRERGRVHVHPTTEVEKE